MRRYTSRTAACALSVSLALGAAVVPCAASEKPKPAMKGAATPLTRLSPASHRLLSTASASTASAPQEPPSGPSSPSSFFHSKRGAVTVVLMSAGTGFALWSIQHDRKPVKSPIR